MPKMSNPTYPSDSESKTIRFSEKQIHAVEAVLRAYPAHVHTFTHAIRALICRPEWLKPAHVALAIAAFED